MTKQDFRVGHLIVFGQLIVNLLGDMKASGRDPFFPEDDEMIKYLEDYFKQRGAGK